MQATPPVSAATPATPAAPTTPAAPATHVSTADQLVDEERARAMRMASAKLQAQHQARDDAANGREYQGAGSNHGANHGAAKATPQPLPNAAPAYASASSMADPRRGPTAVAAAAPTTMPTGRPGLGMPAADAVEEAAPAAPAAAAAAAVLFDHPGASLVVQSPRSLWVGTGSNNKQQQRRQQQQQQRRRRRAQNKRTTEQQQPSVQRGVLRVVSVNARGAGADGSSAVADDLAAHGPMRVAIMNRVQPGREAGRHYYENGFGGGNFSGDRSLPWHQRHFGGHVRGMATSRLAIPVGMLHQRQQHRHVAPTPARHDDDDGWRQSMSQDFVQAGMDDTATAGWMHQTPAGGGAAAAAHGQYHTRNEDDIVASADAANAAAALRHIAAPMSSVVVHDDDGVGANSGRGVAHGQVEEGSRETVPHTRRVGGTHGPLCPALRSPRSYTNVGVVVEPPAPVSSRVQGAHAPMSARPHSPRLAPAVDVTAAVGAGVGMGMGVDGARQAPMPAERSRGSVGSTPRAGYYGYAVEAHQQQQQQQQPQQRPGHHQPSSSRRRNESARRAAAASRLRWFQGLPQALPPSDTSRDTTTTAAATITPRGAPQHHGAGGVGGIGANKGAPPPSSSSSPSSVKRSRCVAASGGLRGTQTAAAARNTVSWRRDQAPAQAQAQAPASASASAPAPALNGSWPSQPDAAQASSPEQAADAAMWTSTPPLLHPDDVRVSAASTRARRRPLRAAYHQTQGSNARRSAEGRSAEGRSARTWPCTSAVEEEGESKHNMPESEVGGEWHSVADTGHGDANTTWVSATRDANTTWVSATRDANTTWVSATRAARVHLLQNRGDAAATPEFLTPRRAQATATAAATTTLTLPLEVPPHPQQRATTAPSTARPAPAPAPAATARAAATAGVATGSSSGAPAAPIVWLRPHSAMPTLRGGATTAHHVHVHARRHSMPPVADHVGTGTGTDTGTGMDGLASTQLRSRTPYVPKPRPDPEQRPRCATRRPDHSAATKAGSRSGSRPGSRPASGSGLGSGSSRTWSPRAPVRPRSALHARRFTSCRQQRVRQAARHVHTRLAKAAEACRAATATLATA